MEHCAQPRGRWRRGSQLCWPETCGFCRALLFRGRPPEFDGSASWQHFEYTSIVAASGIPIGSSEPGFQPLKWSLGAQYDAHIPNGGKVIPRLDFIYSGGYQTVAVPDSHSDLAGYHELNARLSYRPESDKWEAAVVGTNLANTLWYTQIFDLYGQSGADYGIPTPPRTIWVEFKKKF